MNPLILYHIRDHLNAATDRTGPWPIASGIEWNVIDPRLGNLRERIYWNRGGVGVIWREGSRDIRRTAGGIEATGLINLTAYFPSMEQFAFEGEYLLLEEALYHTLHNLPPEHGLQFAHLVSIQDMTLQMGDDQYAEVLVLAAQAEARYLLGSPEESDPRRIRDVIIELVHTEVKRK
ncbi:MAG: hypothetical protein C4321_05080 [Chloroflexota bacterium]